MEYPQSLLLLSEQKIKYFIDTNTKLNDIYSRCVIGSGFIRISNIEEFSAVDDVDVTSISGGWFLLPDVPYRCLLVEV